MKSTLAKCYYESVNLDGHQQPLPIQAPSHTFGGTAPVFLNDSHHTFVRLDQLSRKFVTEGLHIKTRQELIVLYAKARQDR